MCDEKKIEQQMTDKSVKRKIARTQLLSVMKSDPGDKHHGTITGYKTGCRCGKCSRAWRIYKMYGPKKRITAKEKVWQFLCSGSWDVRTSQTDIARACGISKSSCCTAIAALRRDGKIACSSDQADRTRFLSIA